MRNGRFTRAQLTRFYPFHFKVIITENAELAVARRFPVQKKMRGTNVGLRIDLQRRVEHTVAVSGLPRYVYIKHYDYENCVKFA